MDCFAALAMTEQVVRPSLSNSHLKQQAHHRVLAAHVARVIPLALPLSRQGRREGRAPAGTRRSVRHKRCTRGGPQVSPDRPAFPARMVLTVSFVLSSGSDALLPPSPHGSLMCASGRIASSPQGLTHRPRASGPHDFSVRARLRMHPRRLACAHHRGHAKTLSAPCRSREGNCSRFPALQCRSRPTPSRPSLPGPRFVTIAIRPLSRARVSSVYAKSEFR